MYMALKHTHMLCALLSFLFFLTRSTWAFQGSGLLKLKFVKIAPHVIDTFFLLSAIGLIFVTAQYPFVSLWVTVKLFGIVTYIILGVFTLKEAKNNKQRAIYFSLASITYCYIFVVARSKDPLFFTSFF